MYKYLLQGFNHMTTGELKAEWNLILVKKKKKAGQEFVFFFNGGFKHNYV